MSDGDVHARPARRRAEEVDERASSTRRTAARRRARARADPPVPGRRPADAGARGRAVRRRPRAARRADGAPDARRARRRARRDAGRRAAAAVRLPARRRRGRDRARQPARSPKRSRARPRSPTRAASRCRACSSRSSARCEVTIEGQDVTGAPLRLELEELDARVVQHELDHLDGVLMLDRTDDESRKDALASALGARCAPSAKSQTVTWHSLGAVRIAVAATAPFGADVLERLAARHDIAALLTRPDSPQGAGASSAAPPAKVAAERLGIPVLQPERPTAELELPGDAVVVAAYGLLIPESLLANGPLAQRPPVAPAALARRRSGRAGAPGRRRGDGRDDPPDASRSSTPARSPRSARSRSAPEDDAGAVYARAAELAVELLDEVLPSPVVRAAGGRGHLRGEDRGRRPRARPRRGPRRA